MTTSSLFTQLDLGKRSLMAQQAGTSVAGHNIANALTPQFRRQEVVQQALPDGGVLAGTTTASETGTDLATDLGGRAGELLDSASAIVNPRLGEDLRRLRAVPRRSGGEPL
mgnify:CR=1 FL=1